MNCEPLVRAIVAAIVVLEHSSDEEIDPHVAVRGLESIAYELLKLGDDDRAEFKSLLDRVARTEGDAAYATFVRSIPYSVGMDEVPP